MGVIKYKTEDEKKEARRKSQRKYDQSEKGKQKSKKWRNSEKGKEFISRANKKYSKEYRKTEAYKKGQRKYYLSDKAKETFKKWANSKEGKESIKKSRIKRKDEQIAYLKEYRKTEAYKKSQKKYQQSEKGKNFKINWLNSEALKESRRKSFKKKLSTIEGRLEMNYRIYIWKSLKKDKLKKSHRLEELLGCSIKKLKSHLKSLFTDGMSWNNYGEWEVDHIIPIDFYRKNYDFTNPEVQKECFHFSNLQPLWQKDNIKKSNKLK